MNYINDIDLLYELILSKGKGYLTHRAQKMLILICERAFFKLQYRFKNEDDKQDCFQQALLMVFKNWYNFNEKRYTLALPYITEIFKRGMAEGMNIINNKKWHMKDNYIRTISLEKFKN